MMKGSKPDWLKVRSHRGQELEEVEAILKRFSLNTVCEEASCPNRMECFNRKTATFMIMGKVCTRNCTFCDVSKGQPHKLDPQEPLRVAQAVRAMDLKHVVITSVTRDDLPDGGAAHFVRVIESIRELNPEVTIEVLIPDFGGDFNALLVVINANPEIINHNLETVPKLYSEVRPMASYQRSLSLLENVKKINRGILTKSGIMLGLGEEEAEVIAVLKDLRKVDCDLLTIGQYLPPSAKHHKLVEYVHPDTFQRYKELGLKMGFKHVASAPLVRSSYHADKAFKSV